MKILLINISLRKDSPGVFPPVGLGYIASAIYRAGFELEIIDIDLYRYTDKKLEKLLLKKNYDVVAFGCIVTGYKIIKNLAKLIKKCKNVPIIAGNSVATSIPELLLKKTKVDIAVIGEGDITIIDLLNNINNNKSLETVNGIYYKQNDKIIKTHNRDIIKNIDDIKPINWDLFDIEQYISKNKIFMSQAYSIKDNLKSMPINTARGCPYRCTFCYHVFKNDKYRTRSPRSIIKEIKSLKEKYNINFIGFWDELTFYSKKQCEKFIDSMLDENLQIHWSGSCRADLLTKNDFDIAVKIKKSGCVALGGALESANSEILKAMNKHLTINQFKEHMKVLQSAGLSTPTSLVIGYPQETEKSINETFNCCYELGIYPSVGYLLPQPKTPIYEYAIKCGKIKDEEKYLLSVGDRQDFTINLTHMKQSKIENMVKNHLQRISKKLNVKLNDDEIIKTKHYIINKKK